MPAYEFRCDSCGYEADHFIPIDSDDRPACPAPECDDAPMRKLFTAVPSHFKGGGWGGSKSYKRLHVEGEMKDGKVTRTKEPTIHDDA